MMKSISRWRAASRLLVVLASVCGMILTATAVGDEPSSRPTSAESATVPALELERRNYGASEDRLQARGSEAREIDLAGQWQMAGRDADTSIPFGSGKTQGSSRDGQLAVARGVGARLDPFGASRGRGHRGSLLE